MYPHRIRLRGPWECQPIDAPAPPPHRVTMPCRWPEAGLAGFRGSARFLRKFGYPGRIDAGEHVWLTCAGCTGCTTITLNGQRLTPNPNDCFAVDVTAFLGSRNQLEAIVVGNDDTAGMWGEVALEIRRDAYLADLRLQPTDLGLALVGQAVGAAPAPLELYTLADGQHVDYRTITPTPAGQPFRIDLPGISRPETIVRIEMIHISAIWYAAESPVQDWLSAQGK